MVTVHCRNKGNLSVIVLYVKYNKQITTEIKHKLLYFVSDKDLTCTYTGPCTQHLNAFKKYSNSHKGIKSLSQTLIF